MGTASWKWLMHQGQIVILPGNTYILFVGMCRKTPNATQRLVKQVSNGRAQP
jgi:hypothetical protein